MTTSVPFTVRLLRSNDVLLMEAMLTMFGEAFEEFETCSARPDAAYLVRLLDRDHFIALAALNEGAVLGGLVAYELEKFEQARKEIYIYDLAVAQQHRRLGIGTALIESLKQIGKERGANVIFVQADHGGREPAGLTVRPAGLPTISNPPQYRRAAF
jgi:aminoglycoside 3-N-acetyltransferase I